MHRFVAVAIAHTVRLRVETPGFMAFHNGGVVFVGRQHVVRCDFKGVFNHFEQRLGLFRAVYGPVGVKNLVAAVLRVCLGKHIKLNVVRVAIQFAEILYQIINFVVGQCQA